MLMRLVIKFMHEPCFMFYHITKILRYIKNRKYALPIVSQFYHCIQIATLSNNHFVFTFRNPLTTHLDKQRGRTVNVEGTWYDPAVFQPRVPPTLPVHASLTLDNGSPGARRHPHSFRIGPDLPSFANFLHFPLLLFSRLYFLCPSHNNSLFSYHMICKVTTLVHI